MPLPIFPSRCFGWWLTLCLLLGLSTSRAAFIVLSGNVTENGWNVPDDGVRNDNDVQEEYTTAGINVGGWATVDITLVVSTNLGFITSAATGSAGIQDDMETIDGATYTYTALASNFTPTPGASGVHPADIQYLGVAFQEITFSADNGANDQGNVIVNGNTTFWRDNNSNAVLPNDPFNIPVLGGFPATSPSDPNIINSFMIDRPVASTGWRVGNTRFLVIVQIPEPGRALLLGIGLVGMALRRRR